MPGLRELWRLGDAQALSPEVAAAVEQLRGEFSELLRRVNETLRALTALAPKELVDSFSVRRDALYDGYQGFLSAVLESSPADANTTLSETISSDTISSDGAALLSNLAALDQDLHRARTTASSDRRRWDTRRPQLEVVEQQLAQAVDQPGNGQAVARGRKALGEITAAANRRDYRTARERLDKLAAVAQALLAPDESVARQPMTQTSGPIDPPPVVPTDPDELANWQNPLIQADAEQLFNPARMEEVADMHFQGESTPENNELNVAMKAILFADADTPDDELFEHVKKICELRGIEDEQVARQQFERFKQVKSVNEQMAAARGEAPDEVLTTRREEYLEKHGDFLGTRSSLRYGQVVGDATGLDPALAAILNPTGGMVGWGMDVIAPTDANSPIVLHGIFHDAGGYLLNYQNTGPGYTYVLDALPESGERGLSPVQGQVEGLGFWYERRGQDKSVFEDMLEPEFTAADPSDRQLAYDRFVSQPIEDTETFVNELTEDRLEEVRQLVEQMSDLSAGAIDGLKSATEACGDAIQAGVTQAGEALDAMAEQARELGVSSELVDAAQRGIRDSFATVNGQLEGWAQSLSNEFDEVGDAFDQGMQSVTEWTAEVGNSIRETTDEWGESVDQGIRESLITLTHDKDVQYFARRGVNLAMETGRDLGEFAENLGAAYVDAKTQLNAFYDDAVASAGDAVDTVANGLAAARDRTLETLATAEQAAVAAIDTLEREVQEAAGELLQAGRNVLDAAAGVVDSIDDAVDSGVDMMANSVDSAGDYVAGEWDRLVTLFG